MTKRNLTRRAALASLGGTLAAGLALPASASAGLQARPGGLAGAAPTARGRLMLTLVKMIREAWHNNMPDEEADPEAYAEFERYCGDLNKAVAQVAVKIADAPCRTLSDIVDRAIVGAWTTCGDIECFFANETPAAFERLFGPVLALGGIHVEDCSELA